MPRKLRDEADGWEGLLDPDTGLLSSAIPLDTLWVPSRVHEEGGVLFFDWDSGFGYRPAPPTLLEEFLGARGNRAIVHFAEQFGPLGVAHSSKAIRPAPQPFLGRRGEETESIKDWRQCQSEFNLLLALAAALREGAVLKRATFEALQQRGILSPAPRSALGNLYLGKPWPSILENWDSWSPPQRLQTAARVLTNRVTALVRACGLQPALALEPTEHALKTHLVFQDVAAKGVAGIGVSLIGALTVQLLAAMAGTGFAVCSGCGGVFVPGRRHPAFGRRRYCAPCRDSGAPERDAKTDFRKRQREADSAAPPPKTPPRASRRVG